MRLPNTDLEPFPLSLGTAGLGTDAQGDDAFRVLDAYVEAGGNFLDSAHVYAAWISGGAGASERTVGAWLRSRGVRERTIVSTKGGHPPMGDWYPHPSDFLSAKALREDLEQSLERLGTDRIDLFYLHRDDGVTPVREVIDRLNELPGVRYFGASNWSTARIAEANAYASEAGKRGFVALQSQWSLAVPAWQPEGEPTVRYVTDEDHRWCATNGVAIHAYSAAANGYFAKEEEDSPFAGNAAVRERARDIAHRLGRTPTQIALAWLLAQPGLVVPIVGTTKVERLREAFGALDVHLDEATRNGLRGTD